MKFLFSAFIITCTLFIACNGPKESTKILKENPDIIPAASGFNQAESDSFAIALADSVALSLGGKRALDSARFIFFNFFGARKLWVDRHENKVRIESNRTDMRLISDLDDRSGKVFIYGEEQSSEDSVKKFMDVARAMYINDTYWLLFPFKLKDSGVTLTYAGVGQTLDSVNAHKLNLVFDNVGETPENRYVAYVNPDSYEIDQWEFYQNASDSLPRLVNPFKNYTGFNGVYLSLDRGNYKFSDVEVHTEIPDSLYQKLFETL